MSARLFTTSASGAIRTLSLVTKVDGSASLEVVACTKTEMSPSFLLKGAADATVYCSFENKEEPSSIAVYNVSLAGDLQLIEHYETLGGSCHQTLFNEGKALAIAEYDGFGITTWKISSDGRLSFHQKFTFEMQAPGPVSERQEAPHPHQIVIDPSRRFLTIVDLGADLIRVFRVDESDSTLTEQNSIRAPPGSGPRHGTFHQTGGKIFFYLVNELSSTLVTFSVKYAGNLMLMEQLSEQSVYGPDPVPSGAYACDILVSPDNKFLLTCSRLDYKLQIDSFKADEQKKVPSDTLQVWAVDANSGALQFQKMSPSGGMNPRHFSLNKAGTMLAIALIGDHRVVIYERDTSSGSIGKLVAHVDGIDKAMCVIWDE